VAEPWDWTGARARTADDRARRARGTLAGKISEIEGAMAKCNPVAEERQPFAVGEPFNPYKMFNGIFIPDSICRWEYLSPGSKLVYGRLCRFAGKNGKAYPSIAALSKGIGISPKQARRYVRELEDEGFVRPQRAAGRASHYAFIWHSAFNETAIPNAGVVEEAESETPPICGTTTPPSHGSTPLPDMGAKESHIRESAKESHSLACTADAPSKPSKAWFDERHETWYRNAYWNHAGKQNSRKAYEKAIGLLSRDGMDHEAAAKFLLLEAANDRKRFETTKDWEWRRNLHPATWLNGQRWEDEVNHAPEQPKPRRLMLSNELFG
jgi:Helix-turn-helix domain